MSSKVLAGFLIVVLVAQIAGCSGVSGTTSTGTYPTGARSPAVIGLDLPENRSFSLGMTPFPYNYSGQAVAETYRFTDLHTDLIMQHFDQGVPWPEASAGQPFDPAIEADLQYMAGHRQPGQRVYLSLTPLSFSRDSLAPYWGSSGNLPRPGDWASRDFDDPAVVEAYTNYCRSLIGTFQPDYVAYGIEVNMLAQKSPAEFEKYVNMTAQVYGTLKAENPDLPLILTLQAEAFHGDEAGQREAIRKLLPYTDYLAVSSYPYGSYPNPDKLPADWFSDLRDLAPEKPFAIAETGFPAEDLSLPAYGVSISGSEDRQARYALRLLSDAGKLDARFVVWFVPRDYDQLWVKLEADGADELLKMWKDDGLADGAGQPRKALAIWDAWLALPVKKR